MNNSAVAPVVAVIVGIILLAVGGPFLAILGAFLVLGGGVLFVVRLIGMAARAAKKTTD
jgi:hypothetical protein